MKRIMWKDTVLVLSVLIFSLRLVGQSIPKLPEQHPRILVTTKNLAALKERRTHAEFKSAWDDIKSNSSPVCQAFTYLLTGDEAKGKAAISSALSHLTQETASRTFFNSVFRGALVYDWCYPLLSSSQKSEFIKEFARIHNLHKPYWPVRLDFDAITGHDIEGWFWNELLASIAVYNEDPTIYNAAAKALFTQVIPPRNFFYKSHMHHQGWYAGTRYIHPMIASWVFKNLFDMDIFSDQQQYMPYQFIYNLRPDGQQFRSGDVTEDAGRHEFKDVILEQTANYFQDPYLRDAAQYFGTFNKTHRNLLNFITSPSKTTSTSIAGLPLTKYFDEPVGSEMIARTGWNIGSGSSDMVVQMRIGSYYFGNHQHKDFGTFQIYYKGNLTGDSGMYKGSNSKYNSDHWVHYYRSTTAHNGLLIYDPKETYSGGNWSKTTVDGGVRWGFHTDTHPNLLEDLVNPDNGYRLAEVIAYEIGPDPVHPEYSYIAGDLTTGYTGRAGSGYTTRAKEVTRSMITLNTNDEKYPGIFVVYDRIEATNASFKKTFLLHSMKEPKVSGNKTTVLPGDGESGKLVSYTLMPQNPTFKTVSGYKIGGKDFNPGTKGGTYEDMSWRLEVSPSGDNQKEEFLHVMSVMDNSVSDPGAEKLLSENLIGAKVLDRVVMFSKSGSLLSDASLNLQDEDSSKIFKILICNLEPGLYTIQRNGAIYDQVYAGQEGQTVYFQGQPGDYMISKDFDYFSGK